MNEQEFHANVADSNRFAEAIRRFDALNSQDPTRVTVAGEPQPREQWQARCLSAWIMRLNPAASEALRLAARCQHLCRWQMPRSIEEPTRAGYLRWRAALKEFHAAQSAAVLQAVGYDEAMVARVRDLNLKRGFPRDAEARTLEDGLCLVFLEQQLEELATRLDEEKVLNALRKSWTKMTEAARAEALKLKLPKPAADLLQKALVS